MSLGQLRSCLIIGRQTRGLLRQSQRCCPALVEGQRHLTTDPSVYKKAPYPYETKKYGLLNLLTDFTSSRLNENSVVITVDGPPCSGKTELAKYIAEEFHLCYLRAPVEEDIFVVNGFDIREMNPMLENPKMRAYDMEMMLNETDPSKGRLMHNTQMNFFRWKLVSYIDALRHVLSTGQGVVVENSVWGDAVWTQTLHKLGYLSKNSLRYYKEYRANALFEIWKPQLVLHIEGSTPYLLQQMKAKNPHLANAPGLTEELFDTLKDTYKKSYLPYMNDYSEVLSYDVTDLPELDLLTLDLEKMDLASVQQDNPTRFDQWRQQKEEFYSMYRFNIFQKRNIMMLLDQGEPYNLPEEMLTGEEFYAYEKIKAQVPELRYCEEVFQHKDGTPRYDQYTQNIRKDSPFAAATEPKKYFDIA